MVSLKSKFMLMCSPPAKRHLAAFALLLCTAWPVRAATVLPAGETVWQGEVVVEESVRVPRGGLLSIRPGTTVRVTGPSALIDVAGRIVIAGTADRPVRFTTPDGWQGISFVEAEAGSSLAGVHISGAEAAVSSIATDFSVTASRFGNCGTAIRLLRESSPLIAGNRFENNDMAIDNEMRSAPTIRDNVFTGHRKTAILASHNSRGLISGNRFENNEQGIGLMQPYPDTVENNVFVGNKLALYCNQTKNTPRISRNRFEGNELALVNYSFAYPEVEDNLFIDNTMAIRNDQYGSPQVRFNRFSGNGTALYNYRKSNPVVENNVIEKSERAIYCDYSSYPRVKNNNFSANGMAVELGIYQSADWEKRSGSKPLMQQEAQARQSRNPMLGQAPTEFADIVDVGQNWWGDQTGQMAKAGSDADLPMFYDRHDKEWVTYEGFGPDRYRIDRVVFLPCLDRPVSRAGQRTESP